MLDIQFSPFPVIETERFILRRVTMDDLHDIFLLRSDPEVMKYVQKARPETEEEARPIIEKIMNSLENNDGITWAMCFKDDMRFAGMIGLWRFIKEHYRAEIGYTLNAQHHRKGYMHEALEAVIRYGFETLKLHSIEGCVNPENDGSIALLEKNGFVREAYFREDYFFDGKFYDSAVYSLINPAD